MLHGNSCRPLIFNWWCVCWNWCCTIVDRMFMCGLCVDRGAYPGLCRTSAPVGSATTSTTWRASATTTTIVATTTMHIATTTANMEFRLCMCLLCIGGVSCCICIIHISPIWLLIVVLLIICWIAILPGGSVSSCFLRLLLVINQLGRSFWCCACITHVK